MKKYKKFLSNISRGPDLTKSLGPTVISNEHGLFVQINCCDRIPAWALCKVDSRGRFLEINFNIHLVTLLLQGSLKFHPRHYATCSPRDI